MRIRRALLIIALALLGAYAALPVWSGLPAVQRWVAGRIAHETSWDVRFDRFRVGHDLTVTLTNLSLAQRERTSPFFTAERLEVSPRPSNILDGEGLTVRIAGPHLHMAELPSGGGTGASPSLGALDHAEVTDAFVHVPAGQRTVTLGPLSLTLDALVGAPGRLALAGEGPLPDAAGTVRWSADLGSTLAESHGSVTLESASPIAAVRAWAPAALPPALTPVAAGVRVEWRGSDAGTISFDADTAVSLPIAPSGLRLHGTGAVDPAAGAVRMTLNGSDLALRSADGTRAASGLDARVTIGARRTDQGMSADLELRVPGGEVLWDRFYADLQRYRLSARGRIITSPTQLTLEPTTIWIAGVGKVDASGTYDVGRADASWRAELDLPGLGAAYRLAIREPLQADYPLLGRIEIDGKAGGVIERRGTRLGGTALTGRVDLDDVTVTARDPHVEIRGLDVHLPIDFGDEDPHPAPDRQGMIRMRELTAGAAVIGSVALPLQVRRNLVAVAEPVRIAMLGGALELSELAASGLGGADTRVRLGLAVHDMDLAEISRAAGGPTLRGRVVGAMPALMIDRDAVHSEGEIRADVFGGTVRLRNLRVEELLSPVPTVRLDLDIDEIALAELTSTFSIGGISGVASGGVRDLQIAGGQPTHFDAWLETVPRAGVPQRISVTAIRQLSIIGGTGGDPISLGVLGFFDEYRYAKMGFRCQLRNDEFILRGVEAHDDAEYLVVGTALPPRVNVISHTRVISFSELMARLSRVRALEPHGSDDGAGGPDTAPATR